MLYLSINKHTWNDEFSEVICLWVNEMEIFFRKKFRLILHFWWVERWLRARSQKWKVLCLLYIFDFISIDGRMFIWNGMEWKDVLLNLLSEGSIKTPSGPFTYYFMQKKEILDPTPHHCNIPSFVWPVKKSRKGFPVENERNMWPDLYHVEVF